MIGVMDLTAGIRKKKKKNPPKLTQHVWAELMCRVFSLLKTQLQLLAIILFFSLPALMTHTALQYWWHTTHGRSINYTSTNVWLRHIHICCAVCDPSHVLMKGSLSASKAKAHSLLMDGHKPRGLWPSTTPWSTKAINYTSSHQRQQLYRSPGMKCDSCKQYIFVTYISVTGSLIESDQ